MVFMNDIINSFHRIIDYPNDIAELKESANLLMKNGYSINPYVQFIDKNTIGTIQEYYSETFDFNEKTALYMTSHLEDNSNKRISLITRLADIMQNKREGYKNNELPDYIPNLLFNFEIIIDNEADIIDKVNQVLDKIIKALDNNIYQSIYQGLNLYIKTRLEEVLL